MLGAQRLCGLHASLVQTANVQVFLRFGGQFTLTSLRLGYGVGSSGAWRPPRPSSCRPPFGHDSSFPTTVETDAGVRHEAAIS